MKYNRPLVTHTSRFQKNLMEGPVPEFDPSLGPCLLWTGGKMKSGYGLFRSPSGHTAHRFAWEDEHGDLPDTHEVHHRCRVRLCVRLSHLEPLTVQEHMDRHTAEDWQGNGPPPKKGDPCRECGRPSKARGLCVTHYERWLRARPA